MRFDCDRIRAVHLSAIRLSNKKAARFAAFSFAIKLLSEGQQERNGKVHKHSSLLPPSIVELRVKVVDSPRIVASYENKLGQGISIIFQLFFGHFLHEG